MSGERLTFERLEVGRLPGLERDGFTLEDLSPGVTVLHGPNASGKSTTGRAVRQLLWPEIGAGDRRRLRAALRIGERPWEVELDHDRRDWSRAGEPADPPAFPPAHHADRYGLALHDLLSVERSDDGFARRIAEEAAGGFDLAAARRAIDAKERPTWPRRAVDDYRRARQTVAEIEQEQRRLDTEAAKLAELRRELDVAQAEAVRLEGVHKAVSWHAAKQDLEEAQEQLDELPAALERLAGDELERLGRLEEEVTEAEDDLEALAAEADAAGRRRAAAGLPDEGVPRETLDTMGRWAVRLQEIEREAGRERRALAEAEERRRRARSALGEAADPPDEWDERLGALGPAEWERLVRLARRMERIRAERERLDQIERWLAGAEVPEDLDRLRDGVRLLRRWLATPVPGWRAYGPAALAGLLALALGGAVLAGLLKLPPGWPEFLPWIAVGAAGGLMLWIWIDRLGFARRRRELAAEDARIGLAPPTRWAETPVRTALDERVRLLDRRRLDAEKAALRPGLEVERRELARRAAELEAERARAVDEIGAAPILGDAADPAPLAAFADALARWREAHLEVGAREAACATLEQEREHLVTEIDAGLRSYGLEPIGGGEEAASAVEDLRRRADEHRRATDELAALTGLPAGSAEFADPGNRKETVIGSKGKIGTVEERLHRKREAVADLYRKAGLEPEDRAGLRRLLDRHPGYVEVRKRVEQLGWEVDRLAGELPDGADGDELRAADPDALADELERLGEVTEMERTLNDRIVELETLVGEAERGDRLQSALAELREKEAALRKAREKEADALVAWELAAWVRRSIARRHEPAVLKGTRNLFARFTRGRYELLDPEGDPPELRARETETGRVRRLGELSAGTRVQLLMAVRLAFVEHQERGPRLPLVLDETLANSDEWAAEAVIGTLIDVARAGRQVIYLTAQHDEVSKWRAALEGQGDSPPWTVIDLGRVRRLQDAERHPRMEVEHIGPEPPPAPPSEDGPRSRDEYAEVLAVPGLDPEAGVGAVHLWYLVDEVDVLHRVLSRGIRRWGRLEAMGADAGAELLGGGEEGSERWLRAAARARCLEVLFAGWRQGRGAPIDRGVLQSSGAVSADRFLEPLSELAEELDGDAAAFLRVLEERNDERVKGFRNLKAEELEEYLREQGHLDDRPLLDRHDLERRALEGMAEEVGEGRLTLTEIRQMIARLPDVGDPPRSE